MKNLRSVCFAVLAVGTFVVSHAAQNMATDAIAAQPGFIKAEFVADQPPTASSHASTIIESKDVLMAAWFGGTQERDRDVVIWYSRHEGGAWSKPVVIADGRHDDEHIQYPTWNPVLFRGSTGPLWLFYKEGNSPSSWWGMVKFSNDNGRTWSEAKKLRYGNFGPIRCKPVELSDGTILSGSSTEDQGWRVHMEWTKNPWSLDSWSHTKPLNQAMEFGAIQPTILLHPQPPTRSTDLPINNSVSRSAAEAGLIQILCRTKQGTISTAYSRDNGQNWTRMVTTGLPNPNSGIDAVNLSDGRFLLVYNHTPTGRGNLNVAISADGQKWDAATVLESESSGEFSYPAVIQSSDRLIHITYTWHRQKIRHVVLDPSKFVTKPIVNGVWPF